MNLHLRRQIATGVEVHDKVKVFFIGKSVFELGDESIVWCFDCEGFEDGEFGEGVIEFVVR